MSTPVTEIIYPPIDSQATYSFIDANVAAGDQSGSIQDDFKKALAADLGVDGNTHSIDDLWKKYIVNSIAGDTSNTESGNPAGRTPPHHAGHAMGHYYSRAHLNNAGNAKAFPGGSPPETYLPSPLGDLTSLSLGVNYNISQLAVLGVWWSADGLKYITASDSDNVIEYVVGTAWDPSDITTTTPRSPTDLYRSQGLAFSPDGLKLYVIEYTNNFIYQYNLSSAYDCLPIASSTADASIATGSSPIGLTLSQEGTYVYICDTTGLFKRWTLSTPWDLSTAGSVDYADKLPTHDVRSDAFLFDHAGTTLWAVKFLVDSSVIYEYSLSAAWDTRTCTLTANSFECDDNTNSDYVGGLFSPAGRDEIWVGWQSNTYIQSYTW